MSQYVRPSDREMDETLTKVISSETFSKSERARDLLRYIVEQTKEGNEKLLKGFSIAVDVFGRDENFDPNNDALVRVHMGRLRDLIDTYYLEEGAADAFRLSIPKGSYEPKFEYFDATASDNGLQETGTDAGILGGADSNVVPLNASRGSSSQRVEANVSKPPSPSLSDGEVVPETAAEVRAPMRPVGGIAQAVLLRLNIAIGLIAAVGALLLAIPNTT